MSEAATAVREDLEAPWERPEDARLFWTQDRTHAPHPITPFTGDVGSRAMEDGFNRAAAAYGLPLRTRFARLLAHSFQAVVPLFSTREEMERGHARAEEAMRPTLARLLERWNGEWLPEIRAHLAFWDAFGREGAGDAELAAHLDETGERFTRLWEIHFLAGIPFLLAPSLFDELYRELFPGEPPLQGYRLVEGAENQVIRAERELWRLSRRGLADPDVRRGVQAGPAGGVPAALAASPRTAAFAAELDAYLAEFGERSSEFMEFGNPSWLEDPSPVIHALRNYLRQSERDLDAETAAAAAERARLVAEARERLRGYPRPVVDTFEFLLRAAAEASFLHTEHSFWIDQKGMYRVRLLLLEAGRRLAGRGSLDEAGDAVQLRLAELGEALRAVPAPDLRDVVRERRGEMDRWRREGVPPMLGTRPSGPPPDSPLHRAIGKFVGGPPQPPGEGGVLRGNPGSAGIARGRARVVHDLADAGRVRPGDVLVARTTAPPWTPLFATVAAVVTDAGGVLSHCAIVAREYRIPAVLGTGVATRAIPDGALVEVDGTAGTVRVLPG